MRINARLSRKVGLNQACTRFLGGAGLLQTLHRRVDGGAFGGLAAELNAGKMIDMRIC